MSHFGDNDFNPGHITNPPQHPYPVAHLGPGFQTGPQFQLFNHSHHHQPQQQEYFAQLPPTQGNGHNSCNNITHPHQPSFSDDAPSNAHSTFDLIGSSFAVASPTALIPPQLSQKQVAGIPASASFESHPHNRSALDARHQKHDLATTSIHGPAIDAPLNHPDDMRYLKGPLDAISSSEQYEDDNSRCPKRLGLPRSDDTDGVAVAPAITSSLKKRGRNVSQNQTEQRPEPVKGAKRARGRPRLESSNPQDSKERRKEQIRFAQRAYRYRKETTIVELEAKVAELETRNAQINDAFQGLLVEYAEKDLSCVQVSELQGRLQQFQSMLVQLSSNTASHGDDEAALDNMLAHQTQPNHAAQPGQPVSDEPENPEIQHQQQQQQQHLLDSAIAMHDEQPDLSQEVKMEDLVQESNYCIVRMANAGNASFGFNIGGFYDNAVQTQWAQTGMLLP
ncbi:hypothetical protein F4808DRAFT_362301 [Astrocystis sublimbata]|nr:hypothetical protein F4808DRAFT_362301 [Astrocystis sublimbata]